MSRTVKELPLELRQEHRLREEKRRARARRQTRRVRLVVLQGGLSSNDWGRAA
jgi:hypothetical protein